MTKQGLFKELAHLEDDTIINLMDKSDGCWLNIVTVSEEKDPAGQTHAILHGWPPLMCKE